MNTYLLAHPDTVNFKLLLFLLSIGILWGICRIVRYMSDDIQSINGATFDPNLDFEEWDNFTKKLKQLQLPLGWIEENKIELLTKLLRAGKKGLALDICYYTPVTTDDLLEAAILAPDNATFEKYVDLCRSILELEKLMNLATRHGRGLMKKRLANIIAMKRPIPHLDRGEDPDISPDDLEIGGR